MVNSISYAAPALDGSNFVNLPNTTTASNGLTKTGTDIALGGVLTQSTTLALGTNNLALTSTTGNVGIGGSTAPSSTLQVNGALALPYITTGTATSFPLTNAHQTVRRSASACTSITVPAASTCAGRLYTIINPAGIGSVALSAGGGIFDDVTNAAITSLNPSERISIQSDGSGWIVVGR